MTPNYNSPTYYNVSGPGGGVKTTAVHQMCFMDTSGGSACGRCGVWPNGNGTWNVNGAACNGVDYIYCEASCF